MQASKPVAALALLSLGALAAGSTLADRPDKGRGSGGVIYVESQGLYYDTFGTADLPPRGRFQELKMDGPNGPSTEYGPGEPGYLGGRWWVDVNGNDMMDSEDMYFLCPLLGPGRTWP